MMITAVMIMMNYQLWEAVCLEFVLRPIGPVTIWWLAGVVYWASYAPLFFVSSRVQLQICWQWLLISAVYMLYIIPIIL